jgi:hypothetical protein
MLQRTFYSFLGEDNLRAKCSGMHFQPQGKIRSVWFRYLYSVNSIKTGTITPAVFLKPKMAQIEAHLVNT